MDTTIKLRKETKNRLDRFREHRNESYDDILRKLAYIAENLEKEPKLSKDAVKAIRESRQRLKEGHFLTEAEAKERLGL